MFLFACVRELLLDHPRGGLHIWKKGTLKVQNCSHLYFVTFGQISMSTEGQRSPTEKDNICRIGRAIAQFVTFDGYIKLGMKYFSFNLHLRPRRAAVYSYMAAE